MKRKFLVLFIIFGISAEFIFVFSKLLSASKNKDTIAADITENLGAKAEIRGKIKLKFFPRPKFTISHLRLYDYKIKGYNINIIRAAEFEASVPILNLLSGDISLNEIVIKNSKIHYNRIANSNLADEPKVLNFPYKKLHIQNSDLTYYNEDNEETTYRNLDFTVETKGKITDIKGAFAQGLSNYKFDLKIENNDSKDMGLDLFLSFSGGSLELSSNYNKETEVFAGKVDISGDDIQKLVFNNLAPAWFLYPDKRKSSYAASFGFVKENSKISISEGAIVGEALEGSFSGYVYEKGEGDLNFNFSRLNLDALISNYKRNFIKEEMATMADIHHQGLFLGSSKILVSGSFNSLIFKDKEIGPIKTELVLGKETGFRINELSFQINENNYNSLQGEYKQDSNKQYIFNANINSSGNNIKELMTSLFNVNFVNLKNDQDQPYNIDANLEISGDKIILDNIDGFFGDSTVKGAINYDIAEQDDSRFDLNFSNINFNNYLLYKDLKNYRHFIHLLYENISRKDSSVSLFQRFLWLRNIFNVIHYNLNFDNIIFNNHEIDNFSAQAKVSYRVLDIENINVSSQENDFNAKIMVNLDSAKPYINMNLQAKQADLSIFDYIEEYKTSNQLWSKDFILFPNFEDLDFNFKSRFKKLSYNELEVSNSTFNVDIKDNILNIIKASGDIDNGSFEIKGSFILDGLPQISLSYNFDSFYLSNFLKFLFNIDNIEALVNIAGTLQTYGNTPHIMVKQIKSKNKYYASNIKVDRLALPQIIQDIADLSSIPKSKFIKPLSEEIRLGSTYFSSAKGELNIINGIILINNIRFSLDGLEAAIAGKIDIVNKLIKINSIVKFAAKYKSNNGIRQTPITITHSLDGDFNKQNGTYDLFQLKTFTENLKSSYIKLLDSLETNN